MPRTVFEKLATVQMLDVRIPTTDGRALLLTRHTEPSRDVNLLLDAQTGTAPSAIAENQPETASALTPRVMATFWGCESFTNDLRKNAPPVAEVGLNSYALEFRSFWPSPEPKELGLAKLCLARPL